MVWLPVRAQVALTTAADAAVEQANLLALADEFQLRAVKCTYAIRGLTPGEGPINVGVANADLTDTEIEEAISASPTRRDDIIALERAKRPVRLAGTFPGILAEEVLDHGNPVITSKLPKIGWSFSDSTALALWGQNGSGATLTTGAVIEAVGVVGGYWI